MITAIAEGIVNKYNASSVLKSTIGGGMYFTSAPQDVVSPWCTFYFIGSSREEIAGGASDALIDAEIQFSLFSEATDGGYEIAEMIKQLTDIFDWASLIVGGYTTYKMEPNTIGPVLYIDEVWQATVTYNVGIERE